ncbi:unnamed protein product, partial [Notodromas monacha]
AWSPEQPKILPAPGSAPAKIALLRAPGSGLRLRSKSLIASQPPCKFDSQICNFPPVHRVLTYYTMLTESYWRARLKDNAQSLKGFRVQRNPGAGSDSRDPSTYVLVSDVNALVPFPGRTAENKADVNSFLKNSLAILNLPKAFSTAIAGFIRIATDVGPNLAGFSGVIQLFTYPKDQVLRKLRATVNGTACPASLDASDANGTVDTTITSCVSASRTVDEACSQVNEGSSIVVVGADNNPYLVALTRFQRLCRSDVVLSLIGSSMAFADHRNFLCNNLTGVTCGPFPATTTQNPTTKTTVLSTTMSSNATTSTTSQAKTTSRAGNDPVPHGDDPPANASKFRSFLRFLTALLAGGK